MTLKPIHFASFLAAGMLAVSCTDNSKYPGYELSETGIYYQFYERAEGGQKPKMGEFLKMKIINKLHPDSVLFDSKTMNKDGTIQFELKEIRFKGAWEEGLMMMSVGDSASFLISSDSIQKYFPTQGREPFPAGSMQNFVVKLVEINTAEEARRKFQEEREATLKPMREAEAGNIAQYIADNKITVQPKENGLYYIETKKGNGPLIKPGQTVSVLYTGKFLNGEVFDASERHGGQPLSFEAGKPGLIQGWQDAIVLMQKGTKATILLPSSLAYGEGGGPIPPYSPLVFEMEVVDVK